MPVLTAGGLDEDTSKVMLAVLKVQAQILAGKPISEIDKSLLFDVPQICEDELSFIFIASPPKAVKSNRALSFLSVLGIMLQRLSFNGAGNAAF